MHLLETVFEHRSVDLAKNVVTDLDLEVGPNTQDVRVKGCMMDLAHRQPVRNDRLATIGVCNDVSSIEQLGMFQPTH